jgi:carbonic anhydrase
MAIAAKTVIEANQHYADSFQQGQLPMPPARHLAVVTCMDARLDPLAFLGFSLGDIHVIRNAGGRVSDDAIRSLVISQRLLGTDAVAVIHHTDCGMLTFHNDELRARIEQDLGPEAAQAAAQIDFLPFAELAASVREDVKHVQDSPLIPSSIPVYGFIYDVRSGRLQPIE